MADAPPLVESWPFSSAPPEATDQCLFVDGLDSTSVGAEAWIRALVTVCPSMRDPGTDNDDERGQPWRTPVFGYSYRYPSRHYVKRDTWIPIQQSVELFAAHLPPASWQVTPIGFSFGSNIVLLGTEQATATGRARIPRVILIAPSHAPDPQLLAEYSIGLTSYETRLASATLQETSDSRRGDVTGIPHPIRQLCGANSRWPDTLVACYEQLTARGIHIHVVYSNDDLFARYDLPKLPPSLDAYFHPRRVDLPPQRPLPRSARTAQDRALDEVAYHLRVRDADQTRATVCTILAESGM